MKLKYIGKCLLLYARSRLRLICLLLFFALVFAFIFNLYSLPRDAVLYASVLCACIGVIAAAADFIGFCSRHRALMIIDRNIGISLNGLPEPRGPIEEAYQKLLEDLFASQSRLITETEEAREHMSDYYTMWVHQVKIPISAMRLLMTEEEKNSPLGAELFKIEQYVEMALSYIRLESETTDYLFKEYELLPVVKQAVRKYAPLFIAKKIKLHISPMDISVVTDEKWLQFVIEQILSNALKYTKSGSISIYTVRPQTLVIEDTGIGIEPEDIARLGEKGFTGYNGRLDKKSTGLGLYLCREILGRLSHAIRFESVPGKGTRVYIDLSRRDMMHE